MLHHRILTLKSLRKQSALPFFGHWHQDFGEFKNGHFLRHPLLTDIYFACLSVIFYPLRKTISFPTKEGNPRLTTQGDQLPSLHFVLYSVTGAIKPWFCAFFYPFRMISDGDRSSRLMQFQLFFILTKQSIKWA